MPLSSTSPPAVSTRRRVISLRVRVPVLSVQITEADPSVSTEPSFLTTAPRRANRCTPMASTRDRIAGSPSGTAATARETPSSSTVTRSPRVETWLTSATTTITTTAIAMTVMPSTLEICAISRSSGVGSCVVSASICAMAPIWVSIPVAVTTAEPTPSATAVPWCTMFRRSPSGTGRGSTAGPLPTARLSPVSEASCTFSLLALSTRASAPTASPSLSRRMSPRTSSAAGTVCSRPSRSTVALGAVIELNAATASSARASCTSPITAFSSSTARITMASTGAPPAPSPAQATSEMSTATSSSDTSGSWNWARSRRHHGTPGAVRSSFGPSAASRRAASWLERPRSGSVPSPLVTSAAVLVVGSADRPSGAPGAGSSAGVLTRSSCPVSRAHGRPGEPAQHDPAHAGSHGEVLRLRVVEHQCVGGLLRVQLQLLAQTHPDPVRAEQLDDLRPVGQVRAGRVAEGVPGAPVGDLEHALQLGRVLGGEAELFAHPGMPVLRERLGELDREPVQLHVLPVPVLGEQLGGALGHPGAHADQI